MIKSKEQKINVSLQMSRDNNRTWRLRVEDDDAGLRILDIEFNHEQFSNLMSTMTTESCKANYYPNKNIGSVQEVKTIELDVKRLPGLFEKYNESARKRDMAQIFYLAEEQNPGWIADTENYNHYRWSSQKQTYSVTLRRYIEK